MVGKQEVIKYEVSDTIGREQNHHECEMKWEGAKARKDSEENTGTKSSKEEIKENETKARNRIKSREGGQRRSNICKTEFPSKKKIPNSEQNKYLMILLKNILRISPVERVCIIWSGKTSKNC